MNKLIIGLLMLGTAVLSANGASEAPVRQPKSLESALERLSKKCGDMFAASQHTRINPDTGVLEEKTDIIPVKCGENEDALLHVIRCFEDDKECGYQYVHIQPGEMQNFKITTGSGSITPRTDNSQEMWILNVKNQENPRLRDNYTLVLDSGNAMREGKIYRVTSIRPDLIKDDMSVIMGRMTVPEVLDKRFVLEGTVDEAIADSCYNIYIADKQDKISDDHLVACVPVINKKFRFETDIDRIKSGRIRALFPGDKLCSAWIDFNLVPGLTLKMTVHNGWYNIENNFEYNAKIFEQSLKSDLSGYAAGLQGLNFNDIDGADNVLGQKESELRFALDEYRKMLEEIDARLLDLNINTDNGSSSKKYKEELYKQSQEISRRMKELVDRYSSNIK